MGATSNSSKQPTGGHKNGGLVIAICGGPGVGKTLASGVYIRCPDKIDLTLWRMCCRVHQAAPAIGFYH